MHNTDLVNNLADNSAGNYASTQDNDSSIKSYAVWYAENNFPIIPLCPHNHEGMSEHHLGVCSKPGKTPLLKGWSQWEVPFLEEIEKWYRYWPKANIGLILGSVSGLVAVDVDGEFGELTLKDWSQGNLPPTWEFTTPGGGRRLLYAIPEGVTLTKHFEADRNNYHEECALLGEGQQTVVPPSIHQNGGIYEWVEGRAPWDLECTEAPEWMIQKMTKKQTTANKPIGQQDQVNIDVIQTLSEKCPMFRQAVQVQNGTGLSEEEWFRWVSMLVKAGYAEQALHFSKVSTKHDRRSSSRIEELKCSSNGTYGPTRCSTIGCDESQIQHCFGKIRTNEQNEITNSPVQFIMQNSKKPASQGMEKWVQLVKNTKYHIDQQGNLCGVSYKKDGFPKYTPLANFMAKATRIVCKDDGVERQMHYQMEGIIIKTQQELHPILVPAADFPGLTWLHQWGLAPNIEPGHLAKDQVRHAIQTFSQDLQNENVYTHLGWRRIDGQWCYLHAGGCVGPSNVKVEVDDRLRRYKLPENVDDPIAAMKASLSLLDLAPKKVTLPLFALMFLAPLCEWLRSVDLEPAFILWLHGESGARKSSLAALFLCHFGSFTPKTPPLNFKDSMNSMEKRTFDCKDSVLLIDDYHPSANPQDAKKMEQTAQQLMRTYGDRVSRGRMRQDTSLRRDYPPRGLALITGEDLISGQSSNARYVKTELRPGELDLVKLSEGQSQSNLLGQAMRGYLEWLAITMEETPKNELYTLFQEKRDSALPSQQHGRLAETAAWLFLGLHFALEYASSIGAVEIVEKERLLDVGWNVFLSLSEQQGERVSDVMPSTRFLSVISELLANKSIHTLPTEARTDDLSLVPSNSTLVGWHDKDYYYFLPDVIYNTVSSFLARQGEHLPVTSSTLWQQLERQGIIRVEEEEADGKVRTRRLIKKRVGTNNRPRLLWIKAEHIRGEEAGRRTANKGSQRSILSHQSPEIQQIFEVE